jgi:anti-sigma28 factor (negative regulator of flagellin synthesis)
MRVDLKVISPVPVEDKPRAAARGSESPPPAGHGSAAIVALSCVDAHHGTPAAVTAKIERIRELIARGEYAVDLDVLATRVVDDDILRTEKPT